MHIRNDYCLGACACRKMRTAVQGNASQPALNCVRLLRSILTSLCALAVMSWVAASRELQGSQAAPTGKLTGSYGQQPKHIIRDGVGDSAHQPGRLAVTRSSSVSTRRFTPPPVATHQAWRAVVLCLYRPHVAYRGGVPTALRPQIASAHPSARFRLASL